MRLVPRVSASRPRPDPLVFGSGNVSASACPWHDRSVYLVLLLAAVAIIGGVVVVAMGRGGEIAAFRRDRPVPFTPIRTPADVATLRLPTGPFGYQVQATADALSAVANLLAERDYEIATLRSELWRLGAGHREPAGDHEQSPDLATRSGLDVPAGAELAAAGEADTGADMAATEQTWRQ